jgi:nucleotide-binding universal stress UspA family protein
MFKRVVVPLDGSECADKAFGVAVDLAKLHGSQIAACSIVDPVLVVGSTPPSPAMDVVLTDMQNEAHRRIDDAVERAREAGVAARGEVITGVAFERILDFAKRNAADVIVMGTHGREGLPRFFMGSVAEMVLRKSSCPVLIVREGIES